MVERRRERDHPRAGAARLGLIARAAARRRDPQRAAGVAAERGRRHPRGRAPRRCRRSNRRRSARAPTDCRPDRWSRRRRTRACGCGRAGPSHGRATVPRPASPSRVRPRAPGSRRSAETATPYRSLRPGNAAEQRRRLALAAAALVGGRRAGPARVNARPGVDRPRRAVVARGAAVALLDPRERRTPFSSNRGRASVSERSPLLKKHARGRSTAGTLARPRPANAAPPSGSSVADSVEQARERDAERGADPARHVEHAAHRAGAAAAARRA